MKHPVLGLQVVPFCTFSVGSPVPIPSSRKKWGKMGTLIVKETPEEPISNGNNPTSPNYRGVVVRVVMGMLVETTSSTGF